MADNKFFLTVGPSQYNRNIPNKCLYHVIGVFRFCADSGTFACLRSKEKMEPDTILRDPNHLANVCVSDFVVF